ncbi:MAG: hypothetical protein FJX65_16180 [Alphaproteobacteria bacterium]|nr:hypothetical protein [Alphaproteobacteria bacterium]
MVLFAGAGFTKGLWPKAPLGKNLFKHVLDKTAELGDKQFFVESVESLFPSWSPGVSLSFEAFLAKIEDARTHAPKEHPLQRHADRLQALTIAALGRAVHNTAAGKAYYGGGESTGDLIRLLRRCLDEDKSVAVITTNYDLYLDKAVSWIIGEELYKESPPPKGHEVRDLRFYQYGFPIDGLVEVIEGRSIYVRRKRHWKSLHERLPIALYKLHGSLNWTYCSACKAVLLARRRADLFAVFDVGHPSCPTCKGPLGKVLIPPAFSQHHGHPIIKRTRALALNALTYARRVAFVGYSAPAADAAVAQLVTIGQTRSSLRNCGPWKYWVIDPDPAVHDRYRAMLGPAGVFWKRKFSPGGLLRNGLNDILFG